MGVIARPNQRKLIFEGNSLSNYDSVNDLVNNRTYGYYIPRTVYANVLSTFLLRYFSFAISGQTQTQINAAFATNMENFVLPNDIVSLWEGTNDMAVNGLSGADAFANLMWYRDQVYRKGAKLVVSTVIARDYVSDSPTLMSRINDYNVLVRNNAASFLAVCDLAADSRFDTRADASNTTYYKSDKIHQMPGGQDAVVSLLTTTLLSVL